VGYLGVVVEQTKHLAFGCLSSQVVHGSKVERPRELQHLSIWPLCGLSQNLLGGRLGALVIHQNNLKIGVIGLLIQAGKATLEQSRPIFCRDKYRHQGSGLGERPLNVSGARSKAR